MSEENGGIFGKKKFSLLRTYRLPEVWGESDTWKALFVHINRTSVKSESFFSHNNCYPYPALPQHSCVTLTSFSLSADVGKGLQLKEDI